MSNLNTRPANQVTPDSIQLEKQKKPSAHTLQIDRVNANEDRNAIDADGPRRVVVLFRLGGKRYALKIAPAWSARFIRERTIYRQLSQPKRDTKYAFDPRDSVRMVYDGKTKVPLNKTQSTISIPVRIKGVSTRILLQEEHAKKSLRTFRNQAKRKQFKEAELPVMFMVTEAPEQFTEVTRWLSAADKYPKKFAIEYREKFFYAFAPVYLRAHLTFGFSHFDLHTNNILCKITFKRRWVKDPSKLPTTMDALPHIRVVPKIYDYDASYSSAQVPPMSDLVKKYGDPKDADLWFHWMCMGEGTCPTQADPKFQWERVGPVHDLSRLMLLFLEVPEEERMTRARRFYTRIYPPGKKMLGRTFDLAHKVNKEIRLVKTLDTFESRGRALPKTVVEVGELVISECRPPLLYPVERIGSDWDAIYRNRQTLLKKRKKAFPFLKLESLDPSDEETETTPPPPKRKGILSWFGW